MIADQPQDAIVQCPSCGGKGHVFFAPSLFNVVCWFIAPFERNDANGVTRILCGQCDGKGYVEWRKNNGR